MDNYYGIIQEQLYSSIINIWGDENVYMDISISNHVKPCLDIFKELKGYRIKESFNYEIYIKLFFLYRQKTRNDRMKLMKLL